MRLASLAADTKTKELKEAQQAYESAQKTLDEAKIQNPVDPLDDIEIQTPALEPPPPTAASLGGPSSQADLDLIAVLTEEVEALKAEVATLNSIIDSKKAPGSAKSDRPTTTHEELRRMNKDYEEQMNNMTKVKKSWSGGILPLFVLTRRRSFGQNLRIESLSSTLGKSPSTNAPRTSKITWLRSCRESKSSQRA